MTDILLVPGAAGHPANWAELVPVLASLGHRGIAVDLPQHDERYGWAELTDVAVATYETGRTREHDGEASARCLVVGQSMGAFVAPLAAARIGASRVAHLVLLNPMIPTPGEPATGWSDRAGQEDARREAGLGEFDGETDFFNDVPDAVRDRLLAVDDRTPSQRSFDEPWPGPWPAGIPVTVLAAADDRLFPLALQRRLAAERLGCDVVVLPGGHCNALSHPEEIATALLALAP
ncbi:alpha/beta fold hydrolase [Serinibacter arcticus]|nr:alpha/beta hydrolase [Serinibacter arcticus]